ncbi:MAG: peptide chain release factor N(5)-glutamine methyltransferase [Candidatus Doudnabacteria bacterium]|jgi:release factor glutamine methyltransferase
MSTVIDEIRKGSAVEIDLLLSHILGKSREFLFMNPEYKLTSIQGHKLTSMIRRRQKGEPMAYILGYKDFYGLRFKVNKNVLIPRPETEELIERLKDLKFKDYKQPIRVLDVGTGSGCIAVTLAKEFSIFNFQFSISASDISAKALSVAKQNAKAHKVKVKFLKSDLLKNIKFVPDIIIANLPYGWSQWKNNTSAASVGLKFEPVRALFTKEKGLYEIHRLLKQIALLPSLPKCIYLEFDPRQKTELSKLIKKYLPSGDIKFHKDFNNLWRFAEITF